MVTFEEILKFNPYHDARGRFASAGGAVSFTYSPGKSNAHNKAIQREKDRSDTDDDAPTGKGFKGTLYHGSPATDIEEFDINRAGENTSSGEKLIFFTDSKQTADDFSYERLEGSTGFTQQRGKKGRVYEVDVEMKHPLDFRNLTDLDIDNILQLDADGLLTRDLVKQLSGNHQLLKASLKLDSKSLKNLGYDGIIANMGKDGHNALEYAVVDSKQTRIIKSAGATVAKTFDEILKFNPYHDSKGRFTTAGTAISFTYAPGKSKAHDNAIERHKERMAAIAPTEAQAKTLKGIESRTRNLKKEQFRVVDREGNVVMQKQGDKNSVSYSIGEARDNFPGNITIHNHPDGGTFSSADLSDIGHGATEIRAASPEGTYVLRNLNHGTKWTDGQKSWLDMRNDIDAASQEFKSARQLKAKVREPYEQQVKPIMERWSKRRDEGAPQEELNKIAKEYTDAWDALQPQVEKATRKAYVDQYHSWYNSHAGEYGFEYEFIPVSSKTKKSYTIFLEKFGKSDGEIVLDRKMKEDVDEIMAEVQREYPRELTEATAKSAREAVLFIGLQIADADTLAIKGGEKTEDFHVTLLYGYFDPKLRDSDAIDVCVQSALDEIRESIPDKIKFDAIKRFPASESSDGKDVIYAQVAEGQLEQVRKDLLKALKENHIDVKTTFPDYKPHMTLAYIDPGEKYELSDIDEIGTVKEFMIGHGSESSHENEYTVMKTDDDKRLVFGWASVSITVDGEQVEDRQKDVIDPEDLEAAAYEYVLNFRDTGEEHISTMRKKGKLVESCVFTAEKQKAMGIPEGILPIGWWIGFKIEDDAAWEKVKNGTYKMFSIEGKAVRVPVEKAARDNIAKTFDEIIYLDEVFP